MGGPPPGMGGGFPPLGPQVGDPMMTGGAPGMMGNQVLPPRPVGGGPMPGDAAQMQAMNPAVPWYMVPGLAPPPPPRPVVPPPAAPAAPPPPGLSQYDNNQPVGGSG